jgi:class 3 adenylate cyclase
MTLTFGLLGPLAIWSDGAPVDLRGVKRRGVVAYLLGHAGEPQPLERIVDALWGDQASPGSEATVQTYVSQLRKLFGSEGPPIVHRAGGYVIELEPNALDATRFEAAIAAATGVKEREFRLSLLEEALALWRAQPLDEFAGQTWADERARQWTRMHVLGHQLRASAYLEVGRHQEIRPILEQLVAIYPLHEPFWGELIVARYRCGEQADALAAVAEARRVLATELGIEPGVEIIELERKILSQDPSLDTSVDDDLRNGATRVLTVVEPLPTGVVTFLLTDIEGSTELWDKHSDDMAKALARHEEVIEDVVSAHSGRLLKSRGEGDATLSVFAGASDAVDAAVQLQQRLHHKQWPGDLNLRTRIALHSGEAQTRNGDYYGGPLNRGARIRGLAVGGQLLVSRATHDLVADRVDDDVIVTELGTHQLKGLQRRETVFLFRHRSLPATPIAGRAAALSDRRHQDERSAAPRAGLAGREPELARLSAICAAALPDKLGHVVLVEGEPGIGVSTLLDAIGTQLRANESPPQVVEFSAQRDPHTLRAWLDVGVQPATVSELAEHDRAINVMSERAAAAGLVLIVDDADKLDQWSVGFIVAMAQHPPVGTVVIVGARTLTDIAQESGVRLARVPGAAHGTTMHLTRLDERALRHVVGQHWPDADSSVKSRWAAHLKSWCDGHPLLVQHALGGATAADDPSTVVVPTSVEVLVRQQLDQLPPDCGRYLAVAAELGSAVDIALVAEICGDGIQTITTALAPAIVSGIVRRAPRLGLWEFEHDVVRQIARRRVDPGDALRWHATAGALLRGRPGREADTSRHLAAAVPLVSAQEAHAAAMDAGALLLGAGAYHEAAERFHEAAALGDDLDQRASALLGRARALEYVGERVSADDAYNESARIAIATGSTDLLASAALGGSAHASTVRGRTGRRWRLQQAWSQLPPDSTRRAEVASELALELLNGGHTWPEALVAEVNTIAKKDASPVRVLALRVVVAQEEAVSGALMSAAHSLVEHALIADAPEHWTSAALAVGIGVTLATGDWDRSAQWVEELANLGARTGEPRARWQSLVYRAVLAEGRGDSRTADTVANEALAVGTRLEMMDAPTTFALHHLGRAYRQGSLADFATSLVDVDDRYRVPVWDAFRAAATLDSGDEEGAAAHLETALHELKIADGRIDHYHVAALAIGARVAARLGSLEVARELSANLECRRGRFVMLGYGGPCLGPVDWHLAAAFSACGRTDEADALTADARRLCQRASANAWLMLVET